MTNTVKIRLRKPRRVFTFICDDSMLRRDDACIVQTERGPEWGTCVVPPEPAPDEMRQRYSMRVLRRVDADDERTFEWMRGEEERARGICKTRIEKHGLPMKLADVECTFDKKKIVFYFTADDRVDFRELVRDLAHDLRARIEMRHIQVRDEAKMVGGLGGCGRELCCTTWLNDFQPISMRMAKKQNLSLNPSKISGQCGRLLCCLAYENDQYETAKKKRLAPRPEENAPPQEKRREAPAHPQAISALPEPGAAPDRPKERERPARPPREKREPRPPRQESAAPQGDAAPENKGDGEKRGPKRRRGGRGRRRGKGGGEGGAG
ncbi:MAG: stage 0 sporulation family protein [Candidatus Hydrogenedens sp.]|nr:stage 0 sporulation family protein [Candidatus Hydrogenedens sp.]